jgi:hypothetical protein
MTQRGVQTTPAIGAGTIETPTIEAFGSFAQSNPPQSDTVVFPVAGST